MRPAAAWHVLLAAMAGAAQCLAAPLFDDASTLEVTLEGPLSRVIEDSGDRREQALSLSLNGKSIAVEVRMRGKSRTVHCGFPPLRLNFSPDSVKGTVFAGQDKLKLVTHCRGNADGEQNVLEEYAAYRILNSLTELSFRTRLLRVRYVDTETPAAPSLTRFAFLVESDEEFAARVGGETLKRRNVSRTMLDPGHAALVYIFQYLIGNTDWSLVRAFDDEHCCHNGKLFSVGESNYYVPYDFDMSGLVNARYAKPQAELRLRSVRIRRYRGYCTDTDILRDALRYVAGRRDEVLAVIKDLPGLLAKNRLKQARYMEQFFEAAGKEARLLREFERRCL